MTHHRCFDFSLLAIALLLAAQAPIASYGLRLVRDAATNAHERLAMVGQAAR